jgi:heat shock protein HslJ
MARPRHADMMKMRVVPILVCAALASALSGCGSGQTAGKEQSKAAASQTPLSGTWAVKTLVDADGQSVLAARYADKVHLTFTNGMMSGDSGCNDLGGPYTQDGADLAFSPEMMTTLVGCKDEPPLMTRLLDVRHLGGAGDVRYLLDADEAKIAELHRR